MIVSVVTFSIMNGLVKYLTSYNTYQIVFFRTIGTLVITIPIVLHNKIPFFGKHKKLLSLRAVLGVISITCYFGSLNYLDVGTAISLRYTSPIFAAIFALIFLKESIKIVQWLFFIIAFFGVLLIKGFGTNINTTGIILILCSAIFLGLIFVVIRKIGNKEHPLVIINYFMLFALVFGGIMSINVWKTPSVSDLFLFFSLGFFGYLGQYFMTKAFQSYKTSVVAPFKYLEVIVTIVFGFFFLDEIYSVWTLLGVLLILSGLFYNITLKKK